MTLIAPHAYTPSVWYWALSGSLTQVWSSASLSYVPVADPGYQTWLASGFSTTTLNTGNALTDQGLLNYVMEQQVLPGLFFGGVGFQSTSTQSWAPGTVTFSISPDPVASLSTYASSLALSHLPSAGGPTLSSLPTFNVSDITGTMQSFTQAQFMAFYSSAVDYVTSFHKSVAANIAGGATVAPTSPVSCDPYLPPPIIASGVTLGTSGGFVPVDSTASAITLHPPGSPSDGQQIIIADVTGAASTANFITFTGNIDGSTTRKLTFPYSWFSLRYYAANNLWKQV